MFPPEPVEVFSSGGHFFVAKILFLGIINTSRLTRFLFPRLGLGPRRLPSASGAPSLVGDLLTVITTDYRAVSLAVYFFMSVDLNTLRLKAD